MPTTIMTCNCVQPFQDKKYGTSKRVFNVTKSGDCRCTSCGRVMSFSGNMPVRQKDQQHE